MKAANIQNPYINLLPLSSHVNLMQVEENRNPKLKGKPLGVTQKYIIVTSNYAARARGVTKLMGIKDAQAVCPEINLVCLQPFLTRDAAATDISLRLHRACFAASFTIRVVRPSRLLRSIRYRTMLFQLFQERT